MVKLTKIPRPWPLQCCGCGKLKFEKMYWQTFSYYNSNMKFFVCSTCASNAEIANIILDFKGYSISHWGFDEVRERYGRDAFTVIPDFLKEPLLEKEKEILKEFARRKNKSGYDSCLLSI